MASPIVPPHQQPEQPDQQQQQPPTRPTKPTNHHQPNHPPHHPPHHPPPLSASCSSTKRAADCKAAGALARTLTKRWVLASELPEVQISMGSNEFHQGYSQGRAIVVKLEPLVMKLLEKLELQQLLNREPNSMQQR